MKKFKNTIINIEGEDGTFHPVQITSLRVLQSGEVRLVGQLAEESSLDYVREPLDIPVGKLRRHLYCSAMVRFTLDGQKRTAAVTHTTCRAWRLLNLDLGVAWVPANALRWSESSRQFMLDGTYEPDFTKDVMECMWEYPHHLEPEAEELRFDYNI